MHGHTASLFPQSLIDALQGAPDSPVFEHGARTVSRAEFLDAIRRLAGALRAAGLGRGCGLAVFTTISPEAFAAQMAAFVLGCRVVGVRPGYPPRHLAHVLGLQVDALLVDPSTATAEVLQAAGSVRLLSLGPCGGAVDLLARVDNGDDGGSLAVQARPDDVAFVTFTSGSSGQPKGCALTYRALGAHWSWRAPQGWSPVCNEFAARFQRYLLFGTLASLVVMEFVAPCLLGGGTAIIPEQDARPPFPYAIERYRITGSIITVPRLCLMLDILARDRVDVSSLRALMVSGSPLSAHRLAAAVDRLGPVVFHGYGQTEAGSISMVTPHDIVRDPARALVSVGRPHPGVEISVRDAQDLPLPTGQSGEIHLRSPYQMAGYWDQPGDTRAVLRDGWLQTRDTGFVDEEGFIHLVGRSRDVIIVNALIVYAGAVEQVLASHPDVAEAYVTGAADEQTGEAIHAFVVASGRRPPDPDTLRALVRTELGEGSVPKTVTQVSAVPVAPSGKPDKRALLELQR